MHEEEHDNLGGRPFQFANDESKSHSVDGRGWNDVQGFIIA